MTYWFIAFDYRKESHCLHLAFWLVYHNSIQNENKIIIINESSALKTKQKNVHLFDFGNLYVKWKETFENCLPIASDFMQAFYFITMLTICEKIFISHLDLVQKNVEGARIIKSLMEKFVYKTFSWLKLTWKNREYRNEFVLI